MILGSKYSSLRLFISVVLIEVGGTFELSESELLSLLQQLGLVVIRKQNRSGFIKHSELFRRAAVEEPALASVALDYEASKPRFTR